MKPSISRLVVCAPLLGALLSGFVLAQAGPADSPPRPGPDRERQLQRRRDGSGLRPAQPPASEPNPQRLDRIFNALDADGDGKIDKQEMARKGPEIMRGLQSPAGSPPAGGPGAAGREVCRPCAQCPFMRGAAMGKRQMGRGFAMRGPGMRKGVMRGGFGQGRGWGRGPGSGGGRMPAFQPPGGRGGFGRTDRTQQMSRPPHGRQMALRMLDTNGNGRIEPPEIRSKIDTLERLLDLSERRPIELDEFMGFGPPPGGPGPRRY